MRFRSCFSFALVAIVSCGGRVGAPPVDDDGDGGFEGGRAPPVEDGAPFVDPTCPDAGPQPPINQCDVLRPTATCPQGRACYPITYPPMGPCESERYGTACLTPGKGVQGDACGGGASCSAGFICVITGGNTQCAKACVLGQKGSCTPGFVCEPIDVPGFAVCL